MESMVLKNDGSDDERDGGSSTESLSGWLSEYTKSNSTSSRSSFEAKVKEHSSSTSTLVGWPLPKPPPSHCPKTDQHLNFKKSTSKFSEMEMEMMKDRFAKLLLGEDMSGSGNGVCPALALSNAITNLCASVFGQLWRLEPLTCEKKLMCQREMEFLLFVTNHIVEFVPSEQTCPDGTKLEVMTSRPRSDILINLPALRKLDNMILDILDSFAKTEFWYIDQGPTAPEANGSVSFRQPAHCQEKKWWLPVPRVPPSGLVENTKKKLVKKRDCAAQILKAAMSIHSNTLAEMEIPESYIETLPKNAKSCLGDMIYRCITSEQFSSECLLDCLDLSSQHFALEIANRVEASIYVWQRRLHHRTQLNANRSTTKSSWDIVKDIMNDGDKVELLAERAENLLLCLKQRFSSFGQTALETSKVHCNKDVGKAILESYSRILASVASNIVSRIDDLLSVDDLTRHSENIPPPARIVTQKNVALQSGKKISSPRFSAISLLLSPTKGGRRPLMSCNNNKQLSPGKGVSATSFLLSPPKEDRRPLLNCNNNTRLSPSKGVKRVLTSQNVGEERVKNCINLFEGLGTMANRNAEMIASRKSL